MTGNMKVAVMTDVQKIEMCTRPIPVPGPDEVLVKLEYVGVCGSDIHYYESGGIGATLVEPPLVLGHEAGGTVVEVGGRVTGFQAGDRVALEPGKTCGHCEFCRSGRYNLCPDVIFFATPPVDGVFQEYVAHEARLCFKIPDRMSTLEAALIEPLSIGFHAARQGGARIGLTAAVTGSGCIGLMSMMALRAMGVQRIIAVDVMQKRLDKALELGATCAVNAGSADVIEAVRDLTGGQGPDLIIETTGSETATAAAIRYVKKGGTIVLVGYSASGELKLPVSLAIDKELTFKTVFRYRHIYPMAIDAVASGQVQLSGVVSHIFSLDEVPRAMAESVRHKADIVKSVIKIC